jgi:ribosome-associated protein YbcJ (S4-like RNA binding protein)
MAKLIVSTEIWNTASGTIAKAVTRNANGTFNGATNQTKGVKVRSRASRPRVTVVGR